jgi:hypothetical protein
MSRLNGLIVFFGMSIATFSLQAFAQADDVGFGEGGSDLAQIAVAVPYNSNYAAFGAPPSPPPPPPPPPTWLHCYNDSQGRPRCD